MKSKLENRRLDYDAKLNKMQKAKTEVRYTLFYKSCIFTGLVYIGFRFGWINTCSSIQIWRDSRLTYKSDDESQLRWRYGRRSVTGTRKICRCGVILPSIRCPSTGRFEIWIIVVSSLFLLQSQIIHLCSRIPRGQSDRKQRTPYVQGGATSSLPNSRQPSLPTSRKTPPHLHPNKSHIL